MENACDTTSKAIHDVMAKVGMDDLPDLVEFVKIFEGKVGTLAEELDKADLPDWANRTIMKSAKEIQTQMRDLKHEDSIQDKLTKVTNVCCTSLAMQRDLNKLGDMCLCIQGWRALIHRANRKILEESRCELKTLRSKAQDRAKFHKAIAEASPPSSKKQKCAST